MKKGGYRAWTGPSDFTCRKWITLVSPSGGWKEEGPGMKGQLRIAPETT